MAIGFHPSLGIKLQDALGVSQKAPYAETPSSTVAPPAQPGMSKGAMIMGLLGDTLASNFGGQSVIAPMLMRQREQAAEDARWGKRLDAQTANGRAEKQWEWQNKPHEDDQFTRMMRASGIDPSSPEAQGIYRGKVMNESDPPITTTLPNGQFYSGPRSGLAAALTGQMQAPPTAPVGKLTPLGGGAGNGVGGFRR